MARARPSCWPCESGLNPGSPDTRMNKKHPICADRHVLEEACGLCAQHTAGTGASWPQRGLEPGSPDPRVRRPPRAGAHAQRGGVLRLPGPAGGAGRGGRHAGGAPRGRAAVRARAGRSQGGAKGTARCSWCPRSPLLSFTVLGCAWRRTLPCAQSLCATIPAGQPVCKAVHGVAHSHAPDDRAPRSQLVKPSAPPRRRFLQHLPCNVHRCAPRRPARCRKAACACQEGRARQTRQQRARAAASNICTLCTLCTLWKKTRLTKHFEPFRPCGARRAQAARQRILRAHRAPDHGHAHRRRGRGEAGPLPGAPPSLRRFGALGLGPNATRAARCQMRRP